MTSRFPHAPPGDRFPDKVHYPRCCKCVCMTHSSQEVKAFFALLVAAFAKLAAASGFGASSVGACRPTSGR